MGKLYFRFGAMGASKTANALMVHYNYIEKGKKAIIITSDANTRDGAGVIKSRIGLSYETVYSISYLQGLSSEEINCIDCIICDESQFFSVEEVDFLASIVDDYDIPVICYGLRTDFQGNLFPASARLMAIAEVIEEIPTICWCGRKAQMNARVIDGKVVREGKQIVLGSNDLYIGLCRKHFYEGKLS